MHWRSTGLRGSGTLIAWVVGLFVVFLIVVLVLRGRGR